MLTDLSVRVGVKIGGALSDESTEDRDVRSIGVRGVLLGGGGGLLGGLWSKMLPVGVCGSSAAWFGGVEGELETGGGVDKRGVRSPKKALLALMGPSGGLPNGFDCGTPTTRESESSSA